ncbi:MAG: hypothetical protein LQ337_007274 [Flavoplaca oasis]|nr:MAG: hypothetical protein LQ337_007274 [Flavoplaca oasis]
MVHDTGLRLIPVPQSYGSGAQLERTICHRSALIKVRKGTGDEPVGWEKQLKLFKQGTCHINEIHRTVILDIAQGTAETQAVGPEKAAEEVRRLSTALFHGFKARHPEQSTAAWWDYIEFRQKHCCHDFSILSQRRTAEKALITLYCILSSLLHVETVEAVTPNNKRRALDPDTSTTPSRKRTETAMALRDWPNPLLKAKEIIEQPSPEHASGETFQEETNSDAVNDSSSQPTSTAYPETPATTRGDGNLDLLSEVYYDHNELPSNLLDLNLPPAYPPRLCSYFTLSYKNDIPPQHNCVSEHVILEDPDSSEQRMKTEAVTLNDIRWCPDSSLRHQHNKVLYRWADTWISRPILDSGVLTQHIQDLLKQVKHSTTIFVLVRWKDSWVHEDHRVVRIPTPLDIANDAVAGYNEEHGTNHSPGAIMAAFDRSS